MNTPPSHNAPTLHLIGNAHLDPVWLWRWQEGCAEAIGTCWAAIDRLDEGEGFIFTKGEAHIYDWIERLEPTLFARIRHYIAQGRWVVVNGWWIQPDCNVPSGESVIRQALYGKRYFAQKFGVEVPTGYNVDSFGHPGTFPMLLQHTGSTSYTFMRPGPHEMDLPAELFTWASPDGSVVTAFRIQGAYNTSKRELPLPEKIDRHQQKIAESGHAFMCFYGVGNHGGAPTIENITEIEARLAKGENLKFSDPESLFNGVDKTDLPRVEGELQFHAIGCYAVASALKTLNRKAESLLEQAEAGATIVHRQLGLPYPRQQFETLWRKLLFNQFHDTLGGTSLESACLDSERDLSMVIVGAEDLLNDAVRQLDRTIARPLDPTDATFVVMNFNGTSANGLVEAEPWVDKDNVSRRVLLDEAGHSIPFQYIDPHGKTTGLQRIGFNLDVPAYGYRVLRFAVDAARGITAPGVGFGAPSDALNFATAGYALTIDPETGAIASLTNRLTGIELLAGAGHQAIVVEDNSDTWSHGTDRFGFVGVPMQLISTSTIDAGPVRTTIKLVSAHGSSSMTTMIVLPEDGNLPVELRVHLDWHERRHLLRLAYPLGAERFEYEVAGGWDARPDNGREVPGQRWVRATTPTHVVGLVNDAKYSYAALDGTLFITAVRSPVFAHHDPIALEPGAHYRYMDQGEQTFTLHLFGAPALTRKQVATAADALNKPVVTTPHVSRDGTAPHAGQWLDITTDTSAIGTLKMAEDGDDAIIRAVELDGIADAISHAGSSLPIPARGIISARLGANGLTLSDGLER
ncbi:glycoside hydrolase family 38 C-terminal domain-containing protein [Devosia algicola]|uniref:Glycoside hydrolase family 38 C-terminal domain-containing protein n=1 Tax=Devosia algicola TaxID=3026418 RepID=A0ABY7YLI7_9HYPH|nr:alpha-mannosidase [Devosia algicola]WDR02052.1 glycoside hydrolase family 38 C-terminal domain-containing protein [Devosia algicola]